MCKTLTQIALINAAKQNSNVLDSQLMKYKESIDGYCHDCTCAKCTVITKIIRLKRLKKNGFCNEEQLENTKKVLKTAEIIQFYKLT